MEIRTTVAAFRKFQAKHGNMVFESKGVLVTTGEGMTVLGLKAEPTREYRESLPILSLGYAGIASHEFGGPLHDQIQEMLTDLTEEELVSLHQEIRVRLKGSELVKP